MMNHRLLNGVAAGLLGTFVSRNNDIGSYWGIGRMYSIAVPHGGESKTIVLDLIQMTSQPLEAIYEERATYYSEQLFLLCEAYGINHPKLQKAIITLHFNYETEAHSLLPKADGFPFLCTVDLIDSANRLHSAEHAGWCMRHTSLY